MLILVIYFMKVSIAQNVWEFNTKMKIIQI